MQVGHRQVKGSIRSAEDMRVTNASLIGYGIARQYRLTVIDSRKGIAVTTHSHIQAMRFIPVKNHQVGSHILFFRNSVTVTEITEPDLSFSCSIKRRTQSIKSFIHIVIQTGDIHILGQHLPRLSIRTDRHFQTVALIQDFYFELISQLIVCRQRFLFSTIDSKNFPIGCYPCIRLLIVIKQQTARITIAQGNFHARFITFISCRSQQKPSVGRSTSFSLYLQHSSRQFHILRCIIFPVYPLQA